MVDYLYPSYPAVDPSTSQVVRNTTGQIYAITDTAFTTPLAFTDLAGVPSTELRVGPLGITDQFRIADHPQVVWKSGVYEILLWSPEAVMNALAGIAAEVSRAGSASLTLLNQAAAAAAASASAAQAAETQVRTYFDQLGTGGGTPGTGGINTDDLDAYLGGEAQQLMPTITGFRTRLSSGAWGPRPPVGMCIAISTTLPGPTAAQGALPTDLFVKIG